MVLAAGLGTRMRPLTLLRAKPALPVMNRPLIHWTLERLARHGVREVVVNLHHLPASVTAAVGDGSAFGLRVHYTRERTILGTGGGPRKARALLGDGPVLIVNGDVLFDFDLGALMRQHRKRRAAATLALLPNPDAQRYSPLVLRRDGRIASVAGRPRAARGRPWLFTGVHVVQSELLDRLPGGASDSVRDLYIPLIGEGARVEGFRARGTWYDFGAPPSYLASQLEMRPSVLGRKRSVPRVHPSARVAPGARVGGSIVGAGCRIDEDATVADSVLWEGVVLEPGAVVRGCIVADGTRVREGQRLEDCIVVAAARLRRARPAGRATGAQQRVFPIRQE
jgi:NDP-sugar pyrophosphorylase family protein